MTQSIFRTKTIDQLTAASRDAPVSLLRRTLGRFDLLALGVGSISGVTAFILIGEAASRYAGSSVLISICLAAAVAFLSALCYAELASMVPISGSAYTYSYAILGELPAWMMAWTAILCYTMTAAMVSIGWSAYLLSMLEGIGVQLPLIVSAGAYINAFAALVVLFITTKLVLGIRESATGNAFQVLMRLLITIVVAGVGLTYSHDSDTAYFMPRTLSGEFGWSGVLAGAGFLFAMYFGVDAVSSSAEEARNPRRDIPFSLMGAVTFTTLLYLLLMMAVLHAVKPDLLNVANPLSLVFDAVGLNRAFSFAMELAILVSITGVILIYLMGIPRVAYQLARDGLLPESASRIHPKYRSPYISTIASGIVTALLASRLSLQTAAALASLAALTQFAGVCIGVLVVRKRGAELMRGFAVPHLVLVGNAGWLLCLLLAVALALHDISIAVVFTAWTAVGLAIYALYGYRHSRLRTRPDR